MRRDDFSIPPAANDGVDPDERDFALAQRRRKLGRWVALSVALSTAVCVAAVVRAAIAHASAREADVVVALPAPPPSPVAAAAAPVASSPNDTKPAHDAGAPKRDAKPTRRRHVPR